MTKITSGDAAEYFKKLSEKFNGAWGSFTINFGAKVKQDPETLYYQIHTDDKIPNCAAGSFYVSFSEKDDRERAPEGWRSITISTHTEAEDWENLSEEEYRKKKEETEASILKRFDEVFEENFYMEKKYLLSGTPQTYEFYTRREKGFVGGIPHSVKKPLITMPPNETPFPGLYMVGDTVFPGQGTPAVVLGALNVVDKIVSH
jgi:phytoene dehydrogenase-like protein